MFGLIGQQVDGIRQLLFESNTLMANSSFSLVLMRTQIIFTGEKCMEECLKSTKHMDMRVVFTLEHLMITIFMVLMSIFTKTTTSDGKEDGKQQTLRLGFGKSGGADGIMTSFGVR